MNVSELGINCGCLVTPRVFLAFPSTSELSQKRKIQHVRICYSEVRPPAGESYSSFCSRTVRIWSSLWCCLLLMMSLCITCTHLDQMTRFKGHTTAAGSQSFCFLKENMTSSVSLQSALSITISIFLLKHLSKMITSPFEKISQLQWKVITSSLRLFYYMLGFYYFFFNRQRANFIKFSSVFRKWLRDWCSRLFLINLPLSLW